MLAGCVNRAPPLSGTERFVQATLSTTLINSTFNICFTLYYLFLRAGHIAAANEN